MSKHAGEAAWAYGDLTNNAPPPIVTTTIALLSAAGSFDGLATAAFQGFSPPVTGGLTLGIGTTAYLLPTVSTAAAPLSHVIAGTPVPMPTVLADINFTTPSQGVENASTTDIGLAATTQGFSGIVTPLGVALQGTTLGKELAPLVNLAGALLTGLGKNGGAPKGGSLSAADHFALNAKIGLSQTVVVLGHGTTTKESGSVNIGRAEGAALANTATDGATLLTDGSKLLGDVQSGNLLAAGLDGVATLGAATALGTSLVPLLTDAASQHNPVLPPIGHPVLSLDLNTGLGQTYNLGLGEPAQVNESLSVQITADKFGDYALGKLLAQIVPQLIADYQGGGTQTVLDTYAQLAQGVSSLATAAAGGFTGIPHAGPVPSSMGADIGIKLALVTTETQPELLGSLSNSQTVSVDFQSNAQGFYDLGTSVEPVLTALLLGALETQGGQEAIQIGGDILTQLDAKFGGGSGVVAPAPETHALWSHAGGHFGVY